MKGIKCQKTNKIHQSGAVKWVSRVRRARRPSSVPLQLTIQVQGKAFHLLSRPVPQLAHVHLVHSQVKARVHLWTKEERIQNTLQNTLAPECGRKPRTEDHLHSITLHQGDSGLAHSLQINALGTLHKSTCKNIGFIIKY